MKIHTSIFVTLFFIVSCGTVPANFPIEENPENLPALSVLPIIKVPLELPSGIAFNENPWVDLSVEIGSNLKPINMKYINSSHPHSTALINNAFKSAKYWNYSPKDLKYIEGKRYLLRISDSSDGNNIKKPIPMEAVWHAKLDRPEIYSAFKNHSASKNSSGLFVVEVTIDTLGRIKKSKIIKSELNNPALDSVLLDTVRRIRIWPFFSYSSQTIVHTYEFPRFSNIKESASSFALKLEPFAFKKISNDLTFQATKKLCISEFPEDRNLYNQKYSNWKMTNSLALSSSQEVLDEIAFYDAKKADLFLNMATFIEQSIEISYQPKDRLNKLSYCKALIMHMESFFD